MTDPGCLDTRNEFAARVAIVTGAGQGMGRAVAARLAQAGAKVVLNDKGPDSLEKAAQSLQEISGDVATITGDVTSRNDVERIVRTALDRFGGIHILVNNAGVLYPTRLLDIEEAEWDLVI